MNKVSCSKGSSKGFTIVELMVATMIFSVILVAITIGVMQFTQSYYKSVYESATQNAARSAAESMAKAIQFGSSTSDVDTGDSDGVSIQCAGGYAFVYVLGAVYDSDLTYNSANHNSIGLYMQPLEGSACTIPSGTAGMKQLLGDNMRVANLLVNSDIPHTVSVTIAYGADDLFEGGATTGQDIKCASGRGSEYCAVSSVTVAVSQRVAN